MVTFDFAAHQLRMSDFLCDSSGIKIAKPSMQRDPCTYLSDVRDAAAGLGTGSYKLFTIP
jgi:hypothetical protein